MAVTLVAIAARLASWHDVFTAAGVQFVGDSDTYYHVLRAQRIVESFPRFSLFDPNLNYPTGAKILWPPLFDYFIAGPAMLAGGSWSAVEHVAAFVPLVFGAATVVLVMALGTVMLGRREAVLAGLILALMPAHVEFTYVGRPDQHAAEGFFCVWVFLAFVAGLRWRGRGAWPPILGAGMALSFWNWQGSGLYLVVLAVFAGAWHIAAPRDAERGAVVDVLARGAAWSAVLLAASLLAFSPRSLPDMGGKGVTGFHVAMALATAAYAALLGWAQVAAPSAGPGRRAVEVLVAAALPVALLIAVPGVRAGVGTNLAALTAANRWYEGIREFQPLVGQSETGLVGELGGVLRVFGLGLLAMPLAVPSLVASWRAHPEQRSRLAFLTVWAATTVVLTLFRRRFELYAGIPMALWLSLGLQDLARLFAAGASSTRTILRRLLPIAGALAVVAPGLGFLDGLGPPDGLIEIRPALEWLRATPRPLERAAVLADWDLGHLVQYVARVPVITSPFGIDGGDGAMEAAARFYLAPDEATGEEALRLRRIGFVLVHDPLGDAFVSWPFTTGAGPDMLRLRSRRTWTASVEVLDAFWYLPLARLYYADGSASVAGPALGGFRLLSETPPTSPGPPPMGMYKLFGYVPGAALSVAGATPFSPVTATIPLLTNSGRATLWRQEARADGAGRARFRIPYAAGANGLVRAGSCVISDGARSAAASLTEAQIQSGGAVTIALPPQPPP